jgi:hypothetical protein
MAQIKVRRVTIKRKDNKPQRKIVARRVVINNQVQRLSSDARSRKR